MTVRRASRISPAWAHFLQAGDAQVQSRVIEFREVFVELGYEVPEALSAKMALSPSLNASATLHVKQNRHQIVISANLMLFVRRMARIVAGHFPLNEGTAGRICQDKEAGEMFAKLLLEMSGFHQVQPDYSIVLDHETSELIYAIDCLAQGHVVGHELAHVCLGHLGTARSIELDDASQTLAGIEVEWARAEELAADFWGMVAQLRWADSRLGLPLRIALWAGDFFMASLGFWESFVANVLWPIADQLRSAAIRQGRKVNLVGPRLDTDHPPMPVRRQLLRTTPEKALRAPVGSESELVIAHDMSRRTDDFMNALWTAARLPFQQGIETSLTPQR